GYDVIFVVSLCVAIVGVAVIALLVRNPDDGLSEESAASPGADDLAPVSLRGMLRLLRRAEFRVLVAVRSALAVMTVSDSLLYLALQQRIAIPSGLFPMLYVVTAASFMTFAIPLGRLADRVGPRIVFVVGYGLLACVYGVLLLPRINYPLAASML